MPEFQTCAAVANTGRAADAVEYVGRSLVPTSPCPLASLRQRPWACRLSDDSGTAAVDSAEQDGARPEPLSEGPCSTVPYLEGAEMITSETETSTTEEFSAQELVGAAADEGDFLGGHQIARNGDGVWTGDLLSLVDMAVVAETQGLRSPSVAPTVWDEDSDDSDAKQTTLGDHGFAA